MRKISLTIVFCGLVLFSCREELPEIIGTLDFDGRAYKTIYFPKVNQTWMAENLVRGKRVSDAASVNCANDTIEFFCSNNVVFDCTNSTNQLAYYTWHEATKICNENSNPSDEFIQGICPEKWRIPNKKDIEKLMMIELNYPGVLPRAVLEFSSDNSGESLKRVVDCLNPLSDDCGSSNLQVLMGGFFDIAESGLDSYKNQNTNGYFWTATTDQNSYGKAHRVQIIDTASGINASTNTKQRIAHCVRCIRDGKAQN